MKNSTPSPIPQVFYGWIVVAAAFVITFIGFGSAYTFSTFVAALQKEFGASRGSVSLVFSIAGFIYFGFGVISGPLADRFGARRLAILGMALIGAGLALASVARSLPEVYLAYGLGVGLGIGCSYVPVLGVVQRWFIKRRAFASGLAVSGIGVGTLILPPLSALLIDTIGWRDAYLVLAVIASVVGIGMAWLVVDRPSDRNLFPDGNQAAAAAIAAPQGFNMREAVVTKRFWALYAACLAASFGAFVPFVHLVPFALDLGIAKASAILLLGVIGVGSTIGRFLLGGLADQIGRPQTLAFMFAGMAATLLIWIGSDKWWMLCLFAFSYGIFYGGWVAVLPSVVMDYFGGKAISSVIGVLYTSVAIGTLIGPAAAGFAFDFNQSYVIPILLGCIGNAVAGCIVWFLSKAK
jgi:MFS family permease